jgi:RNA polymerase sigma-70 factor (ECF subfamily)
MADKACIKFLIQQVIEGNEKAFEQLFRLYYQRLYHFAFNLVHHQEQAEEVVSDVFVKLWHNRQKLASVQNHEIYLYVAIKNQSLNYLNKKENLRVFEDITLHELVNNYNPEQALELQELKQSIEAAVESLPTQCKVVFKLIKEDGLHYKEVAEILGISVRTVETQLARALKKISAALSMQYSKPSFNKSILNFLILFI